MAGFKTFSLHSTDPKATSTFETLDSERKTAPGFAGPGPDLTDLDPETAARRLLDQMLRSDSVREFSLPEDSKHTVEVRPIQTETSPLTKSTIVKFREFYDKIPVYSSYVTVELGENNECISVNSTLADIDKVDTISTISTADAAKAVKSAAGLGRSELGGLVGRQFLYFDQKKWRLVYIFENVSVKRDKGKAASKRSKSTDRGHAEPTIFDFVVDARTGSIIARLPRTRGAAQTLSLADELGVTRTITIERNGPNIKLVNAALNIETYDLGFKDPTRKPPLPGKLISRVQDISSGAVSAHANAAEVATFLRTVVQRNNIDDQGGPMISTINCVDPAEERPPGSRQWLNAFWNSEQMVYGQALNGNSFRSLAAKLDIVAHEMFHGVTERTSDLVYELESGAMNESYSDIFGIIIGNFAQPDIGQWNWLLGDGLIPGGRPFRDMSDPTRLGQPKHASKFIRITGKPNKFNDYGKVHANSGIHNFAAFNIMTSKAGNGQFLFKPADLAAIFYVTLTQQLTRQSTFADSRRSVILVTRSLFRDLPSAGIAQRVNAVQSGFAAAGIN